jgi:hypothetical protein
LSFLHAESENIVINDKNINFFIGM